MTAEKIAEVLEKHKKWMSGEEGGERADLNGADLSYANLRNANLRYADLNGADLSYANLRNANLRNADLSSADLSSADLRSADLNGADLGSANLNGADLRSADLNGADLNGADLGNANLSNAEGLISAADYMDAHFERIDEGYIAYKTFNCTYAAPPDWKIEAGAVLSENVNFNRTNLCGCGINVAPLKWVKREYPNKPIWKVLIRWEWLAGICVPYNTDGKIRCERVEPLEVVK